MNGSDNKKTPRSKSKSHGNTPRKMKSSARYLLYKRLVEEDGLKPVEAGKLLGWKAGHAYNIASRMRKEGNVISKAMPDALLRKANRRAKQLLDGKAFGPDMKEVKCSTVAKLVEETWKRQYPLKQDPGAGGDSFNFTTVNISLIQNDDDSIYSGFSPHCVNPVDSSNPENEREEHSPSSDRGNLED